jgi:hypothetical protein
MPIPPRYQCDRCEDWRIVVAPDGRGTIPCPACISPGTAPQLNLPKEH